MPVDPPGGRQSPAHLLRSSWGSRAPVSPSLNISASSNCTWLNSSGGQGGKVMSKKHQSSSLKLVILACASQSRGSRIENYQMHFPSSVNGSLLTPSFLRGDCPKLHAITAETNTPGLHVRYCKFHNSCKQGQTAAQWQSAVPPSMPGASEHTCLSASLSLTSFGSLFPFLQYPLLSARHLGMSPLDSVWNLFIWDFDLEALTPDK